MKSPTRIEILSTDTVMSAPLRLSPVYVPHAVLVAVIALAWIADGAMAAVSYVTGY